MLVPFKFICVFNFLSNTLSARIFLPYKKLLLSVEELYSQVPTPHCGVCSELSGSMIILMYITDVLNTI